LAVKRFFITYQFIRTYGVKYQHNTQKTTLSALNWLAVVAIRRFYRLNATPLRTSRKLMDQSFQHLKAGLPYVVQAVIKWPNQILVCCSWPTVPQGTYSQYTRSGDIRINQTIRSNIWQFVHTLHHQNKH